MIAVKHTMAPKNTLVLAEKTLNLLDKKIKLKNWNKDACEKVSKLQRYKVKGLLTG